MRDALDGFNVIKLEENSLGGQSKEKSGAKVRGLFSLRASQRCRFCQSAVEKQSLLRESSQCFSDTHHPIQCLRGQSLHNVRKPDTGESFGFEALSNLNDRGLSDAHAWVTFPAFHTRGVCV